MASSNASPAPPLDTDTAYNAGSVTFANMAERHSGGSPSQLGTSTGS